MGGVAPKRRGLSESDVLALIASNTGWVTGSGITRLTTASDQLGVGTATPDASAKVEIVSTTTGFLGPRMTTTQRDAISSPASGLEIYNTTTNLLNVYNGTTWVVLAPFTSFTDGSIPFASSGTLSEDAGQLFWDATNNQLAIGTGSPDESAQVQIDSITRGFLGPRMTTVERDAISSPATGLLIFNVTTALLNFFTGAVWAVVEASTAVPGGADTNVQFNDSGNFGGNSGFVFDPATGRVGIGGSSPAADIFYVTEAATDTTSRHDNSTAADLTNKVRKSHFLNVTTTGLVEASRTETQLTNIGQLTNDSIYRIFTRQNDLIGTRVAVDFFGVRVFASSRSGGAAFATTTDTASLKFRDTYSCTDTSSPRTLTISSADIARGSVINPWRFIVKDESGGATANNITVDTQGSETIDGVSSVVISVNFGVLRLYSNGTNLFSW